MQAPTSQRADVMFAEATGALPRNYQEARSRAIGLPEASAHLREALGYWLEHDGADATASAPGAKAAERTRKYIQHLMDRGGDGAPKCPVRLELDKLQLQLSAAYQNQQEGQQYVSYSTLTSEEQSLLASLTPLSYNEATELIPSLTRFLESDVEQLTQIFRST